MRRKIAIFRVFGTDETVRQNSIPILYQSRKLGSVAKLAILGASKGIPGDEKWVTEILGGKLGSYGGQM